MPVEIAQYILEISHLNNIPRFEPHATDNEDEKTSTLNFIWDSFMPTANPTKTSIGGFTGKQLQYTYNLDNMPSINGTPVNGAGQTLVIIDGCGTANAQQILTKANEYFTANDITPFRTNGPEKNFAIIQPDGKAFHQCKTPGPWDHEISLDMESSHTIATGANTVLVIAENDLATAEMDIITQLTTHNFTISGFSNAYVISNSWGASESKPEFAMESALQVAAAYGISVNFSSGDCGDFTYSSKKCTAKQKAVNYPSSSAYVTAVGATALFVDDQWNYAFETVWGTFEKGVFGGGTGGGISKYYGPVAWQTSIKNFKAGGYGKISAHGDRRALPDISMLGEPHTGLQIYAIGKSQPLVDGGTSLACPLFSATLTLVNQARLLLNKGTPIGHAAPYLYQFNTNLRDARALNLIIPPHQIISGAKSPPKGAPSSAFTMDRITYGWDSSLRIEPEKQFWNDAVGVGSPYIPNFVTAMANM